MTLYNETKVEDASLSSANTLHSFFGLTNSKRKQGERMTHDMRLSIPVGVALGHSLEEMSKQLNISIIALDCLIIKLILMTWNMLYMLRGRHILYLNAID
jgi:hypothetical protein